MKNCVGNALCKKKKRKAKKNIMFGDPSSPSVSHGVSGASPVGGSKTPKKDCHPAVGSGAVTPNVHAEGKRDGWLATPGHTPPKKSQDQAKNNKIL